PFRLNLLATRVAATEESQDSPACPLACGLKNRGQALRSPDGVYQERSAPRQGDGSLRRGHLACKLPLLAEERRRRVFPRLRAAAGGKCASTFGRLDRVRRSCGSSGSNRVGSRKRRDGA